MLDGDRQQPIDGGGLLDAVEVEVEEDDDEVTLTLVVDESDMGRVIGRDGRIANAIRSLLRVMGARDGRHVELDIVAHE